MKPSAKYTLIGIALIAINIAMVVLGSWLDVPAFVDLPSNASQRMFNSVMGIVALITIAWWAPASIFAIVLAVLAEYWQISKIFVLVPTIVLMIFQCRIGGWLWTRIESRIKEHMKSQQRQPG